MGKYHLRQLLAVPACCVLGWSVVVAADRPADKILAEINAITVPAADASKEPAEISRRQKLAEQKAKLILELYKTAPARTELARLMPERWQLRPSTVASSQTTKAEIGAILLEKKNPALVIEAAYYKANLTLTNAGASVKLDNVLPAIEEFAKRAPKDDRVPQLLFKAASSASDKGRKADVFARIQKDYPDSPVARSIADLTSLASIPEDITQMVGLPFKLEFTDAIKGLPVSIEGLKGKVVVVDFWATWCGPCVAEMPNMKKLYAKFKDQGVEFIGVSLDQSKAKGGLDKLKEFVAKNEIGWPQYYQGNYWQGEFSGAWHINSIPRVFLVDADGKLASVDARGKLDELIPRFLEKAKKSATKDAVTSR